MREFSRGMILARNSAHPGTRMTTIAAALLVLPAIYGSACGQETTLSQITVNASADASAAGLPAPYAGGQVARGGRVGVLGSQDNMDTPLNITSYTQALIQNQQAASVGDVLLNDPAVRVARGFGNFQQLYMVRGLPVYSDDMSYNGLYGLLPRQYLAAELVERVEVLRGANAFLNGAAPGGSGLGGAVNVMPKRAANEPLTQVTTGIQSGGQVYVATDLARRFVDDRLGLRVNAVRRDGDTAVKGESRELSAISLGADYRDRDLRISADIGYQDHRMKASQPSITIATGLAIPSAPDASRSVAQPWTYSNEKDTFATLRAEYDLNDSVTAWIAGGMRQGEESASFANPTVINAGGDTSSYRFDNTRKDSITTGEAGVRGKFTTGEVGHTVTLSTSAFESKSKNAYGFSNFAGFANNIYRPSTVGAPAANFFTGGSLGNPLVTEKVQTSSVALADVLSLMKNRLLLTIGARHQKIENFGYDYNTGAQNSQYAKSAVTPIGGVLYKLTPQLSAYANYIEGLVKGDVAPANFGGQAVSNVGQVLEPYKTKQTEVGLKWDTNRIGGAISLFQSRKPTTGLNGSNAFGVIDHQRNQGLELMAYGEATRSLKVLGGISFLNTNVNGKDAIGAPGTQANLGLEWAVPSVRGFSLDSRVIYTSAQYADMANSQKVPAWTRLDLGARYMMPMGSQQVLTVRARVENLTDKNYWASAGGYPGAGYLTVGAPRTFVLSATVDF